MTDRERPPRLPERREDSDDISDHIPAGFLAHLPPDQQAEYGAGEGPMVKGVGRLHTGWPKGESVLVEGMDPYAPPGPEDKGVQRVIEPEEET